MSLNHPYFRPPENVSGVLQRLLKALRDAGIVTEDLALPDDWDDLENVYRGLCRLPDVHGARRRRIDILTVPWQSRGAALLYYTGDDIVRCFPCFLLTLLDLSHLLLIV